MDHRETVNIPLIAVLMEELADDFLPIFRPFLPKFKKQWTFIVHLTLEEMKKLFPIETNDSILVKVRSFKNLKKGPKMAEKWKFCKMTQKFMISTQKIPRNEYKHYYVTFALIWPPKRDKNGHAQNVPLMV